MQFDLRPSQLSADEQMEIFLEGCQELNWEVDSETGFRALNPATKMILIIDRIEETELEFPNLKNTMTYRLTVHTDVPVSERKYTTIRTGDYTPRANKLLEALHRTAMKKSQVKFISGDAQVSTG